MNAVLQVDGLHKAFGGIQAVADVAFAVSAGELLALIGPNGAGKSTCFNMLNGQLAPDSGVVQLAGRDIVGLSPRAIWLNSEGSSERHQPPCTNIATGAASPAAGKNRSSDCRGVSP